MTKRSHETHTHASAPEQDAPEGSTVDAALDAVVELLSTGGWHDGLTRGSWRVLDIDVQRAEQNMPAAVRALKADLESRGHDFSQSLAVVAPGPAGTPELVAMLASTHAKGDALLIAAAPALLDLALLALTIQAHPRTCEECQKRAAPCDKWDDYWALFDCGVQSLLLPLILRITGQPRAAQCLLKEHERTHEMMTAVSTLLGGSAAEMHRRAPHPSVGRPHGRA